MNARQIFHVYDSHTAGASTRLLLEGVPFLEGKSMGEKKKHFQENYDFIRTTLIQEPRGNSGILAVLVPPSKTDADYGMIFSDYRGYVDMCLHGTIGIVTTLIECGLVGERILKKGEIKFDTPAGPVRATFNYSNGKVQSVSVINVQSFMVNQTAIEVPDFGKVEVSVAFGGNFYAYVNAKNVGLKVIQANLGKILSAARLFLRELRKLEVAHPQDRSINEIVGVCFFEDLGEKHARNIMIADSDLFDRSPCGTGTCGRMAILNANGSLELGEVFRNESIIGSEFRGTILKEKRMNGMRTIVPEITGSAYLTGISDVIVSDGDKLGHGYLLTR